MFSYNEKQDAKMLMDMDDREFVKMVEFMTSEDIEYALGIIESAKNVLEIEAELAFEQEISDNLDMANEVLKRFVK